MSRERTVSQRFDTLQKLTRRYGDVKNIPERYLEKLRYAISLQEDGVLTFTPYEVLDRRRRKGTENEQGLNEKAKRAPLINIETQLISGGSTAIFRFLTEEETHILSKKLASFCIDEQSPNFWDLLHVVPKSSPMHTFMADFSNFITSQSASTENLGDDAKEEVVDLLADAFVELNLPVSNTLGDPLNFLEKYVSSTFIGSTVIEADMAKTMYDQLEIDRGKITDLNRLKSLFKNYFNMPFPFIYAGRSQVVDLETLKKFCQINNIKSNFDAMKYFFGEFITSHTGSDQIAKELQDISDPEEVTAYLERADFSTQLRTQEKELKKQIQQSDTEGKKQLSLKLSQLKIKIKSLYQLKLGMIQFFNLPGFLVNHYSKGITDVQEYISRRGTQKENVKIFLDGSLMPEIDLKAGEISGDCTIGKPLPFDKADIPVYNVKVKTDDGKYIGNIYLLQTEDRNGSKIWHLDAIQIPKRNQNWDLTIKELVQTISQEAKTKGIDFITVNKEGFNISNYDYISDAVIRFSESIGIPESECPFFILPTMPSVFEEEYSYFQATGNTRVLWRNINPI